MLGYIHMFATKKAAASFIRFLSVLAPKKALVVGLYGDLGVGKTTFTQEAARLLGIKEQIISPTFVILRIYEIGKNKFPFKRLIHIDAYRLDKPKELSALGFKDLLKDKKNLILVEWANKVLPVLPKDHRKIIFEFAGKKNRKISYDKKT